MSSVVVSSGQTSSSLHATNAGDTVTILNGGSAVQTLVRFGGVEIVDQGGFSLSAVVQLNGSQTISSGGLATFAHFDSGCSQEILSGGVASSSFVRGVEHV